MTKKPVSRVGDIHICPLHPPNFIIDGINTVQANGRAIAVVGSHTGCGAQIISGADFAFVKNQQVAHIGSMTSHGGTIVSGSHNVFLDTEYEPSAFDQFKGGVKAVVNALMKFQSSLIAEWFSDEGVIKYTDKETGKPLSSEEVSDRILNSSEQYLPITPEEQPIADLVNDSSEIAAMIQFGSFIATRGRSGIRQSGRIARKLRKALKDSRSSTEAIGKLGMEEAKKRQGFKTDERYIDRYHGPDDIVKDQHNKLAELEAKGTNKGSTAVAKNTSKERQSSAAKNQRRAKKMLTKKKKVNTPSNRQGGPYTQEEYNLWEEIYFDDGQKRHISTHTNTETGQVKVLERDSEGEKLEVLDDFFINEFEQIKKAIMGSFKK